MFEIDKTRKHFVPLLYLRGFCIADGSNQLYVFDKDNPQAGIKKRSIENVEVSRDAYSVANDSILKRREDQWAKILQALEGRNSLTLNEFISDRKRSASLRAGLARFVVDSKMRSRGFREQMREPLESLRMQSLARFKKLESDFRAQLPDSDEQANLVFPALRDLMGVDNDRKFRALHIDPFMRGEDGEEWYMMYEDGSWRFDEACVGRKFMTSDIPSTSMRLGSEPQYHNLIFFFMPLSSDLQLMGMCKDARMESGLAPKHTEMNERDMDLANLTVFKDAFRFVYSSSRSEILRAMEQSGH